MTGPDVAVGLSDGDVARRVAEGKTNDVPTRAARSVSDIVRAYVFTLINAILSVLFVIVAATGWVQGRVIGVGCGDDRCPPEWRPVPDS
jgi:cation-transporting P-type ATPase E